MAFAIWPKKVRCPNCQHEGWAENTGSGGGWWLFVAVAFIVAGWIPVFWLVAVPALAWVIFQPSRFICAKCKFPHPITL